MYTIETLFSNQCNNLITQCKAGRPNIIIRTLKINNKRRKREDLLNNVVMHT